MMDRECPKCQDTGLKPVWHKDRDHCKIKDHSNSNEEHLHYYCKYCGYDFIILIDKEGQDDR